MRTNQKINKIKLEPSINSTGKNCKQINVNCYFAQVAFKASSQIQLI